MAGPWSLPPDGHEGEPMPKHRLTRATILVLQVLATFLAGVLAGVVIQIIALALGGPSAL